MIAACLFSATGLWEFRYRWTKDLDPWAQDQSAQRQVRPALAELSCPAETAPNGEVKYLDHSQSLSRTVFCNLFLPHTDLLRSIKGTCSRSSR